MNLEAALTSICCAGLGAFVGVRLAQNPSGVTRQTELTVRGLKVVDSDGFPRVVIGESTITDGIAFGVSVCDSSGKPSVRIAVDTEASPRVEILDKGGHSRAIMTLPSEDQVTLRMGGKSGEGVAHLSVGDYANGCSASLLVRDSNGKYLCTLPAAIGEGEKK